MKTLSRPSTGADGPPPPAALSPSERRTAVLPYVALGVVLLLWGFGPPVSKLITAPPLTTSFTRLWTSVVAIFAVQYALGTRFSASALRRSALGGIAFGANSLVFFYALRNASIATITVLGALQPVIVMLGASKIFGERITRWGLAFTAVAIGGATIAVLGAGAKVHTNGIGVLCSIGSLLCMSVYFLASKRARASLGAGEYVMGVMICAAVFVTPIVALGGGFKHFDAFGRADWMFMGIMLIGPGVGGQLLMGWAVRFVPVSLTSMILLGSTVVSIVAAWPIQGETPTILQFVGGAITLGSVAAILLQRRRA